MRKTPYVQHPKRFKCKSGIMGWTEKLQGCYRSYEQFASFSETFGLHLRLGYASASEAWRANPQVCGSVIPSDYCIVKETSVKRKPKLVYSSNTKKQPTPKRRKVKWC